MNKLEIIMCINTHPSHVMNDFDTGVEHIRAYHPKHKFHGGLFQKR